MGKKVSVWIYVCVYVQSLVYNKIQKNTQGTEIVIAFLERTYVAWGHGERKIFTVYFYDSLTM